MKLKIHEYLKLLNQKTMSKKFIIINILLLGAIVNASAFCGFYVVMNSIKIYGINFEKVIEVYKFFLKKITYRLNLIHNLNYSKNDLVYLEGALYSAAFLSLKI